MIGIVVVSHSRRLAEAAVELASIMVHGAEPPVRVVAGVDGGFGTDAVAVAAAIDELAARTPGVLVIPDLGSAVLSAELAVDLRESTGPVIVSDGPFVEGLSAGLVLAANGASLTEIAAEVSGALAAKHVERGDAPAPAPAPEPRADPTAPAANPEAASPESASIALVLGNPAGLHARPVATLVKTAAGFDADLTVRNDTTGTGPVSARSMIGLLSLGAERGHQVTVTATGPGSGPALDAVRALFAANFGE